jgi:hypothetical protein
MKKLMTIFATALIAVVAFAAPASAQDEAVIGTVESDPASVPEAGMYDLTATGSGFIPDTDIILVACTSPADTLVPGVSDLDEIVAAGNAISPLEDCDIANAVQVTVDSDGNWSESATVEVGDNFFFSAGALDGSQAGATWIAITDPAMAELAVTGAESWIIALFGAALLAVGALTLGGARRFNA